MLGKVIISALVAGGVTVAATELPLAGVIVAVIAGVIAAVSSCTRYRIRHELKQQDDQDIQGESTEADFARYADLKRAVKAFFRNYPCPCCGNHAVSGSGVVVAYGKVRFHRQVARKGWFGGTSYKDEHYSTVWRIHELGLRNAPGRALLNVFGLFDDPPGEMRCHARGCGWSQTGERGGTLSLQDVLGNLSRQ